MELTKSMASPDTLPARHRLSKVSSALVKVMRSISYSAPCSRASFMMVAGERRVGRSERISAS